MLSQSRSHVQARRSVYQVLSSGQVALRKVAEVDP